MKKSIIFLCTILCLFSCNKNNGGKEFNEEDGLPTKALLTFTVGDIESRADFPDNRLDTIEGEHLIYNAMCLIFNNKYLLEKAVVKNYYGELNRALRYNSNDPVTEELELTTGTHYFYLIVNAPAILIERQNIVTEGMTIEELKEQLLSIMTVGTIVNDAVESRGFMMTNLKDAQGVSLILTEDPAENPVTIDVGRAMAKVSVAFDPNNQQGGTLSDVEYKVRNNPKDMFVFPNFRGDDFITPHFSENTVNTSYFLDNDPKGYQLAWSSNNNKVSHTYCIENNNLHAKEGNSTLVVIKGKFTPLEVYDALGDNPKSPESDTFWRVANMRNGRVIDYTPKYYSVEPDESEVSDNQKVFKYTGGICYYPLWLYNDKTDSYSVKRNSFYKITINGVDGAGFNDEDDEEGGIIDPEIPLKENTLLDVSVRIVEWDEVEQKTPIGK